MSLGECRDYFDYGLRPESDGQILHEIDWFQQLWKTSPKVFLRYDRIALFSPEDPQLRVTFDHNLCWRDTQLQLSCGDWGHPLLTGSQRDHISRSLAQCRFGCAASSTTQKPFRLPFPNTDTATKTISSRK